MKRNERELATPYDVPERFMRLAAERTDGMVDWWAMSQTFPSYGRGQLGPMPLVNLVRSAYLQGVEDAMRAIEAKPALLDLVCAGPGPAGEPTR